MNYEHNEMELDLRELLYVLKKKILVILLVGLLFAGVAGAYSFYVAEPVYQSTARLYIQTQSTSITSLADIQVGESLALDYVELIQSRTLVEEVIETMDLNEDYESLKSRLSVVNPDDTRILNISITGPDPQENKHIANQFAKVAQRQISDVMKTEEPSLWETAVAKGDPIKPEKAKNIILGFLIGIMFTVVIVIMKYTMDDAIKTSDDVEKYLGLNVLGTIPYEGGKRKKTKNSKKNKQKKQKKSKSGKNN